MKRIAITAVLLVLLTGCGSGPALSNFNLPASVEVSFNVLVPENTPERDGVNLVLLDEVTGASFNSEAIKMVTDGERSFSLTLSVPLGTRLTYRYARQSEQSVEEISLNGQLLPGRFYLADGPGHIAHDLVVAWADLPTSPAGGQLSGIITDEAGQPLAGIHVGAGGLQTETASDGYFLLGRLPQGLHNLVIIDPTGRYRSFQQGALVAADTDTPAQIALNPLETVTVVLVAQPPEGSVPGVPLHIAGDLQQFASAPAFTILEDGRYSLSLDLPVGKDIRYKYTLGDGFWNAEHDDDGDFILRQLILSAEDEGRVIEDRIPGWTVGTSEPIWFDLVGLIEGGAYIQFKLVDWGTPLPMWPLGGGHYAYKLYSPTNFAAPLAYRYCADAQCLHLEATKDLRFVEGGGANGQIIEDQVVAWSE
ncbi:MAG: carboxypeptidase regulatory-like domain-containing protein [Chloroflexi bacterium]|nr:carboxypeptidase regulatory-like domain-containing protein [Chloroflexota bacterium]